MVEDVERWPLSERLLEAIEQLTDEAPRAMTRTSRTGGTADTSSRPPLGHDGKIHPHLISRMSPVVASNRKFSRRG
jgi:hypothetical protein